MLDVETNHQIILLYFKEGLSQRKIAQQLKISRKTVKARVVEYERFKSQAAITSPAAVSATNKYLTTGPIYDSSKRTKRKLTQEVADIIDVCLQENETKRLEGRKKQQLRKTDIHEKLLSAGYCIGYTTVSEYIRTRSAQAREAFIKQGYGEGSVCEFDWAEVKIMLDGKYRRYYLAVFTSAYSNYRYALLFQRQDSLAYKEAHICFFEHIGGVYHQMVYDNMRVAIAHFVGKTEKTPTEGLLQLSRWYQYQWRFCNTAKGNEKGHVERSVEYVRRKVFGFKDRFESFVEAHQYLQQRVAELNARPALATQQSPAEKLEMERKGLYTHPGRMECFSAENLRVDKYATITFGTNKYSVPDHLVGAMVFVKIYSEWLRIYDAKGMVCEHKRRYERFGWQIDLSHYLYTLQRKPGAMAGSVALKQAPQWLKDMYTRYFIHDTRSFIDLLQYCQLNTISDDKLITCVERLTRQSPSLVMAAHVMALLGNQPEEPATTIAHPDPIATVAMQNLVELAAMMSYN
jgi:transposase